MQIATMTMMLATSLLFTRAPSLVQFPSLLTAHRFPPPLRGRVRVGGLPVLCPVLTSFGRLQVLRQCSIQAVRVEADDPVASIDDESRKAARSVADGFDETLDRGGVDDLDGQPVLVAIERPANPVGDGGVLRLQILGEGRRPLLAVQPFAQPQVSPDNL